MDSKGFSQRILTLGIMMNTAGILLLLLIKYHVMVADDSDNEDTEDIEDVTAGVDSKPNSKPPPEIVSPSVLNSDISHRISMLRNIYV